MWNKGEYIDKGEKKNLTKDMLKDDANRIFEYYYLVWLHCH